MENPKYISSLSEYLQAIEALKFHYPNAPLVQNPTSNPFLFRGLSNVSYSLLPGILRGHKQKFEDHNIHVYIPPTPEFSASQQLNYISIFLLCRDNISWC